MSLDFSSIFSTLKVRNSRTYTLRQKDINLARFTVVHDGRDYLVEITQVYKSAGFPPIGVNFFESESILSWLQSRFLPKNRRFVEKIVATFPSNMPKLLSVLDISWGLSLTDDYWTVPEGHEDAMWKKHNLYTNDFSETLAYIAFTGYSSKIDGIASSPEYSTNGMLPKAWRRRNGQVYLYKGGTSGSVNSGLEPYSEYYAYQIASKMQLNAVPYGLEMWKGMLCSTCPLFTSEHFSYVPMHIAYPKMSGEDLLSSDSLLPFREELTSLIIFDLLILNYDRHFGNFGMLRDNTTGKYVALAPIFDNGMSLMHQAWGEDLFNPDLYLSTPRQFSFLEIRYDQISQFVLALDIYPSLRKKVRSLLGFKFNLHPTHNLPDYRLRFIEDIVRRTARILLGQ